MKTRPFQQVDVFTATPYLGNPLAVVLDGTGLSTSEMQHFAQWTNLSETSFVLPPTPEGLAAGADYRVRIFTPSTELPFAGHPTLGSCHAWLAAQAQAAQKSQFIQECAVGLVHLRRDPHTQALAFAAPPLKRSTPSAALLAQVSQALGLAPQHTVAAQILDNGPVWFSLLLDSVQTVLQLTPDHAQLKHLGYKVGVAALEGRAVAPALIARSNREARAFSPRSASATASTEAAPALEVRAFAAAAGIEEDPVTGSLNASLAQWLIQDGTMPRTYTAAQGSALGRAGRVYLSQDDRGQVWVGGDVVRCITGTVCL